VYPLLGSHGLLDLVSAAGGVTPTASRLVTVAHKSDPEHPEVVKIDTKAGAVAVNVDIRPGDTITVARCGVVYVMGDVGRPGGFLIENNDRLTVLQAVALAQGATRTAVKNKARMIRKTSDGRQEIPLPLNRIMAGKAADPLLEDGDIIFIPSSEAKNLAYRSMEATVGVAASLVVYDHLLF
jgi:polysaccharide export outer membrane protein